MRKELNENVKEMMNEDDTRFPGCAGICMAFVLVMAIYAIIFCAIAFYRFMK